MNSKKNRDAFKIALATILLRDGGDRWIRLAAFSSLADGAGEVFARLAAIPAYRNTPQGRKQLQSLANQIGKRNRRSEVAAVLKSLQSLPEKEKPLARAIVVGLTQGAGKNGAALQKQLAGSGSKAAAVLRGLLTAARKTALNENQSTDARAEAIRSLGLGSFADGRDALAQSLDLRQPQPVQQAAIDTLGRFDNVSAAALVIDAWPALGPQSRRRAEEMLFSRSVYVTALLAAIEAKKIRIGEVAVARFTLLKSHPDHTIREAAARLARQSQQTGRGKIVRAYRRALALKGDPTRGQAVFKKTCAACHKIGEVGHAIGPNLLTLRNRGAESILLNVLDPNREVNPQYLNYAVITTDGRTLTGMIAAETATSLTLVRPDNARDTLLRVDVEALKSSGQSLMPEGMEKDINPQAMADLIAYLLSLEK
ncbi:MAG: c-type cytochrome [Planctomycetes bacterium]|nr:c-type cytochrome [Planctomycetota bacterium]